MNFNVSKLFLIPKMMVQNSPVRRIVPNNVNEIWDEHESKFPPPKITSACLHHEQNNRIWMVLGVQKMCQ